MNEGQQTTRQQCRAKSGWENPVVAACEVVGVLLTAILLQRLVQGALSLESWKALEADMVRSGQADFLRLAGASLVEQLLKYGFILGLGFSLGWWARRRPAGAYGVSRGGQSWAALLRAGIVLWAAIGVLPYTLQIAADRFPALGAGPDRWSLFPSGWSWSFVLYMAVASFALVPVLEELWARGYMVTRLRDGCDTGGAIVVSALFFTFAHTQYFKVEFLSLGMLVSLLVGSLASAAVLLRSGSLVPCVVAHALVNVPLPDGSTKPIVLGVVLLVLAVARLSVADWVRWIVHEVGTRTPPLTTALAVATLALVLAATIVSQTAAIALGVALLVVAIVAATLERWAPAPG